MTRDRQDRNRLGPPDRSKKPVEDSQFSGFQTLPGASASGSSIARNASEWPANSLAQPTPLPSGRSRSRRGRRRRWSETATGARSRSREAFDPSQSLLKLLRSWKLWIGLTVLLFGGSGLVATALLLRLPAVPNCPAIFWPTASASLRIYCAQLTAEKDTVEDLLGAIQLVNDLPNEHPLRPEINRNIEVWSKEILQLCDKTFQDGQLEEAIAMARKVPSNVPAYRLVEERVNQWQSIWSKAEEIYKKAETELRKQNWPQAFREAVMLLDVGNKYWETTKYEELTRVMQTAREDGRKLGKAYELAELGGVENLLEAIKQANNIGQKSHLYREAQKSIKEYSEKLMELAQATLDKRDLEGAVSIVRKIPDNANLKEEIQDFVDLARAQAQTWQGTVASLESAIASAQKLSPKRPLYSKARGLINDWQQNIQELAYLERARTLARSGTVGDLKTAIAQAELITKSNPRWQEARADIDRWNGEIETQEDRPYLDKAVMLARSGSPESLQAAINEASRIGSGRALYGDAQEKISDWTGIIQTQQDRPYLERAFQLAVSGDPNSLQAAINEANRIGNGRALYSEAQEQIQEWNKRLQEKEDIPYLTRAQELKNQGRLSEAIATAQKIVPGRALYDDAQEQIRSWQEEVRAQQTMEDAYRYANSGTPETLAAGIRAANQVPDSSNLRSEADTVINEWSQQMLAIATDRASSDLPGAIEIAQKIPSYAIAYAAAQRQIELWQQQLNPAPAPPVAPAPGPQLNPAPVVPPPAPAPQPPETF